LPLSDFDRRHIHYIMEGHGDWFSAELLRFINNGHPDGQNLARLRHAFPDEVAAVEWWWGHVSSDDPPAEVLTTCPYLVGQLREAAGGRTDPQP
jgi:hypothetical protein